MNTSFSLYIKLRLCAACPSTTRRNLSARHQLGHNQTSSIPIPICKKCKAASAETCFISLLVVPTCRAVGSPRCGLGWTLVEGVNCPQSTELCLTVLSLCYTREWQDWRPFQLFIFFFLFFPVECPRRHYFLYDFTWGKTKQTKKKRLSNDSWQFICDVLCSVKKSLF